MQIGFRERPSYTETGRCALSRWNGDDAACRWCDQPVRTGSRFCSLLCDDAHAMNHRWTHARSAALARDREQCTSCGNGPTTASVARLFLRAFVPMGPVQAAELWRTPGWWALELACSVDVVHRHGPSVAGYLDGCHHPHDGLETRCHQCSAVAASGSNRRTG